jgi:glycerophosphoryl diester phosphodiesterase
MSHFEIVAHRGVTDQAPENTLAAFQRAVELGADAIELDVRLTADKIPVVYHYYYLEENTSASGPIFTRTLKQLRNVTVFNKEDHTIAGHISTLAEVLESFAGKIGLEIEIKGPELEAPEIIGKLLYDYKSVWKIMEVTSFEPVMLLTIQKFCPGIPADFLYPRSEEWKNLDVVPYEAVHYSRLAKARAVHLHPTQLTESVVQIIRNYGVDIHAWDVNDIQSLELIAKNNIARICTDNCQLALNYRESLS